MLPAFLWVRLRHIRPALLWVRLRHIRPALLWVRLRHNVIECTVRIWLTVLVNQEVTLLKWNAHPCGVVLMNVTIFCPLDEGGGRRMCEVMWSTIKRWQCIPISLRHHLFQYHTTFTTCTSDGPAIQQGVPRLLHQSTVIELDGGEKYTYE